MYDKCERSVRYDSSLKLKEGYELKIMSKDVNIDNEWEIYLSSSKDGVVVDSKVIVPSMPHAMAIDKTYYFRKDVGNQNGLVTIAVNFKDAICEPSGVHATVNGVLSG
jgi:hypothetical protein